MQNAQGTGMDSPPGGSDGAAREVKDQMSGFVSQARQGASALVEGAKAQAMGAVDERKGTAAETLGTVAGALRDVGQKLEQGEAAAIGGYATGAAEQVDKIARYLREKDLQGLTRDTETFARRHPEVFLGGAFLAGLLAARFLKSSTPAPATSGGDTGNRFDQGYQAGFGGGYAPAPGPAPMAGVPFNPPHVEPDGGQ